MRLTSLKTNTQGQSAMEFLMILTVVAMIVLVSFRYLMPKVNTSSEGYFNSVTRVVMGEKPQPINGGWCPVEAPSVDTATVIFRTCECPAPAFGGQYCNPNEAYTAPGISCIGEKCSGVDRSLVN